MRWPSSCTRLATPSQVPCRHPYSVSSRLMVSMSALRASADSVTWREACRQASHAVAVEVTTTTSVSSANTRNRKLTGYGASTSSR